MFEQGTMVAEAGTASRESPVRVQVGGVQLDALLTVPSEACGLVILFSGDGDRLYERMHACLASRMNQAGLATLVVDLLTPGEASEDAETSALRFHRGLLAARIVRVTRWARRQPSLSGLAIGYVAGGLCAAAALAAARVSPWTHALVALGARFDGPPVPLEGMEAEILLVVGERDTAHRAMNEAALAQLPAGARLEVLPRAGHLLDDPASREEAARLATEWLVSTVGNKLSFAMA